MEENRETENVENLEGQGEVTLENTNIKIADDVIAVIAGAAASEVPDRPKSPHRRPDQGQGAAPRSAASWSGGCVRTQAAAPTDARGEDDRGDGRPVLSRPPRDHGGGLRRGTVPRMRRAPRLRARPAGEVPLRTGQADLRQLRDTLLQAGDA